MISKNLQQGMGLVEVLVALVLLAIAVLGFSAMQLLALKTTEEGVMRARALATIRGASELMRANPDNIKDFATELNNTANANANIATLRRECFGVPTARPCDAQQFAQRDAKIARDSAIKDGISLRSVTCPNTTRQCLIASWGETTATLGSGANDCGDANGNYKSNSTCFIVEAY